MNQQRLDAIRKICDGIKQWKYEEDYYDGPIPGIWEDNPDGEILVATFTDGDLPTSKTYNECKNNAMFAVQARGIIYELLDEIETLQKTVGVCKCRPPKSCQSG